MLSFKEQDELITYNSGELITIITNTHTKKRTYAQPIALSQKVVTQIPEVPYSH